MDFEGRKAAALAAMREATPDKSPKGTLDAPIVPLLDVINSSPAYFSTSSCSGRITILSHPSVASKPKKKAAGGAWLFVSHDPAHPDDVAALLFAKPAGVPHGGELVFRFEPFILAVECRDVAAAQSLVSTAISCGFRESGITIVHKRIMVAIRCSIRLEVPIGQIGRVMVSREYVHYLVEIANEKFEANRRRTDGFLLALKYKGLPESSKVNSVYGQDQDWIISNRVLVELEARQVDLLSKIAALENDAMKSHSQRSTVADVADTCGFDSTEIGHDTDAACEKSINIPNYLQEKESGSCNEDKTYTDNISGLPRLPHCSFPVVTLVIIGEPVEKLLLWGHSACVLNFNRQKQIIIFGGFGGLGHHARRNYSLLLDPVSGLLKEYNVVNPPSPCLGHTASVVGNCVYAIGGRGGPMRILDEVWVLNTTKGNWMLLECVGMFHPRHRHAAAAVGSKIYVFGGASNELIYSCMNVLNTETSEWSEISIKGEWPCARHSHSMVAYGSQLFMFGGYDGQKALGVLYSFDVRTCLWKKETTTGKAPYPRFSHSMFIYKNYLGIFGGCPVKQHFQELAILNLHKRVWMHLSVDSVNRYLWVRSSTCVVDDELVIIGGGASCYAFGTKFNQPMKIGLHLIEYMNDIPQGRNTEIQCNKPTGITSLLGSSSKCIVCDGSLDLISVLCDGDRHYSDANMALQVSKKYAKVIKDILTKLGWFDLSRRAKLSQDECNVHLPVSRNFCTFFQQNYLKFVSSFDSSDVSCPVKWFTGEGFSPDEVSLTKALKFLLACGGSLLIGDAACSKKISKAPQMLMRDFVCSLLREKGMRPDLLEQLPTRWERLGDIVVLPTTSFRDPIWNSIGKELWPIIAKSLGVKRLARQGRILPTGTRDSTLQLLVGNDGWVTHHENGITYSFDATKCMFSSGNISEKLRMSHLDCRDEIIVDLFAGIGYFVLPFLVKAKAKLVYACEWNPHALKALQHNLHANSVASRCIILEGDNRATTPKGVADRVCLGLLPSSECSWDTAATALRVNGGVLHIHGNVNDSGEQSWLEYVVKSIRSIAQSKGCSWDVSIQHVERVKWYGPHIRHLVVDVRCRQMST